MAMVPLDSFCGKPGELNALIQNDASKAGMVLLVNVGDAKIMSNSTDLVMIWLTNLAVKDLRFFLIEVFELKQKAYGGGTLFSLRRSIATHTKPTRVWVTESLIDRWFPSDDANKLRALVNSWNEAARTAMTLADNKKRKIEAIKTSLVRLKNDGFYQPEVTATANLNKALEEEANGQADIVFLIGAIADVSKTVQDVLSAVMDSSLATEEQAKKTGFLSRTITNFVESHPGATQSHFMKDMGYTNLDFRLMVAGLHTNLSLATERKDAVVRKRASLAKAIARKNQLLERMKETEDLDVLAEEVYNYSETQDAERKKKKERSTDLKPQNA